MANPRPTPKPENLRPPWPPGTSGNPAGYSRGRRISDAIERLIEEMALDREFGATAIAMAVGKKYMLKRKVKDPETGEEMGKSGVGSSYGEMRCRFIFSGKNDELTPDFPDNFPVPPPWPPGTSGNPAGYSRGRRISDAIERLIEEMALDPRIRHNGNRNGAGQEIHAQAQGERPGDRRRNGEIRCRFIFSGKNDELTPDFPDTGFPDKNDELTPDFPRQE